MKNESVTNADIIQLPDLIIKCVSLDDMLFSTFYLKYFLYTMENQDLFSLTMVYLI